MASRTQAGLRRRRERGASIVELALVMPLFMLIGLGLIDMGFVFNDTIRLRNAVKDAGRFVSSDQNLAGINVAASPRMTNCPGPDLPNPFWMSPDPAVWYDSTTPPGQMPNTAKWALCRSARVLSEAGFPLTHSRIRIVLVQPDVSGSAFEKITDDDQATEDIGGMSAGQSVMLCAMVPTTSRTGMLGWLFNKKVLQNKIVLPVTSVDLINDATAIDGTYSYDNPDTGDWSFCDPSTVNG